MLNNNNLMNLTSDQGVLILFVLSCPQNYDGYKHFDASNIPLMLI